MRYFISNISGPDMEGDEEVKFKKTDNYIEREYLESDMQTYLVTYYIPRNDNSIYVATCMGKTFNKLDAELPNSNENFPTMKFILWPTLSKLLRTNYNKEYSNSHLKKMEDPDTGELKWFVVSIVENKSLDDIFNDDITKINSDIPSNTIAQKYNPPRR